MCTMFNSKRVFGKSLFSPLPSLLYVTTAHYHYCHHSQHIKWRRRGVEKGSLISVFIEELTQKAYGALPYSLYPTSGPMAKFLSSAPKGILNSNTSMTAKGIRV